MPYLSPSAWQERGEAVIAQRTVRETLRHSVLTTIRAEPGEWSIPKLAKDYDVTEAAMRHLVGKIAEVEVRGKTAGARLWPREAR